MEISHLIQNDILIIKFLEEKLDASVAPALKEQIVNLIQETKLKKVIIDLSHLQFIDSAGLGMFLFIQRLLNKQEGNLKLAGLNPSIQSLFEMVSMQRLFDIFHAIEEAVKSF